MRERRLPRRRRALAILESRSNNGTTAVMAWRIPELGGSATQVLSLNVIDTHAAVASTSSYVPEVDALRGLAMSAVVAFHCKLLPCGWMGVWLFFVVSGFSVTTSMLAGQRKATGVGAGIWHFYVRRAARIWPLYFAFLGLNVIALVALRKFGPLEELPSLLSFTYNFKMTFTDYTPDIDWPAFGHLWTLAVEQQFYLVFPLLMLVSRAVQIRILLGMILAAPLIRAAVAAWATTLGWDPGRIAFAVYAFAPGHFDAFAAGTLIALFRTEIAGNRRLPYRAMIVAAGVAAIHISVYATIGVLRVGHFSPEAMRNIVSGIAYGQGREISVYLIPTAIGSAMLIGILARERFCLWLCRMPALQAIGRISYGGYLFHVPALMVVNIGLAMIFVQPTGTFAAMSHLALFVCGFPLAVATAWLSFTYFERRFLRIRAQYR
jgi:peptidoglycan/LPS O-acetylase OafA/YrhL